MQNKYKEIKEALESEIHLVEYVDELYAENISLELLKDILDFINSQQAENERLRSMNYAKLDTIHDLQTKIEELEKILETDKKLIKSLHKCYTTAKSEVVTEFAEKLKEEAVTRLHYGTMLELEETECVEVEEIDNILKKWWGKSDV